MNAAELIAALAARDPDYRAPSPKALAALQRAADEAAHRLTATKAREIARLWLPR